jgi:predicted site-specific integrase-resolvase
MSEAGLMNAREVWERLGISRATFFRRRKQFGHLLVTRPVGHRCYSRAKVEQFVAGESTVLLGRRRA